MTVGLAFTYSGFMALIDKKFGDTASGKEARAFYDSKTKDNAGEVASAQERLRAARKDATERAAEDARKRKEERMARAKDTGDEKEIAAAQAEPVETEDARSAVTRPRPTNSSPRGRNFTRRPSKPATATDVTSSTPRRSRS